MVNRRTSDSGVTLIEILVVLALIGVGSGVVMYALPSGGQARTVAQEAALLTARLNLAAERSLIGGRSYKLDWDANGYGFREWSDDGWRAAAGPPLSERHQLDGDIVLSARGSSDDSVVVISPDLLPASDGMTLLHLSAGTSSHLVTFDGAVAASEDVDQ